MVRRKPFAENNVENSRKEIPRNLKKGMDTEMKMSYNEFHQKSSGIPAVEFRREIP